jgi:hypothetical protein
MRRLKGERRGGEEKLVETNDTNEDQIDETNGSTNYTYGKLTTSNLFS